MPSTTNKGYSIQSTGSNVGTWGTELNTNTINLIDSNLGGLLSLGLTNANVTLSTAQAQNGIHRFTGVLTANVIITYPAVGSFYIIENATTGNFSITLTNGVGTSVSPPRSTRSLVATDATNGVRFAGQSTLPPGTILDYAGSSVIASTLGTEFLICDGAAVSRATYAALFAAIGVLWGAGDGSTTFNVPNLAGRMRSMVDAGGSVLSGATTVGTVLGSQTATLTQSNLPAANFVGTTSSDGAHTHTVAGTIVSGGANFPTSGGGQIGTTPTSSSGVHNHTVTVSSGGSGTGHANVPPTAIVYCLIKT